MRYPSMFCNIPIPSRATGKTFSNEVGNGGRLTLMSSVGIPYGLYGRLALVALTTMACNSEANEELRCGSLYSMLKLLRGNRPTGTQLGKFERQLVSWANTVINFSHTSETYKEYRNLVLVDRSSFALVKNGSDSRVDVCFTHNGKAFLADHALAIGLDVIRDIEQPFVFDVFCWLILSLYPINEDATITWDRLYRQFCIDHKQLYPRFRESFTETLERVKLEYYPEAMFETDKAPQGGILLKKSIPPKYSSPELLIPGFMYSNDNNEEVSNND